MEKRGRGFPPLTTNWKLEVFVQSVRCRKRWQIVQKLGGGSQQIGDLAEATGQSYKAVAYHLKRLEMIGIVGAVHLSGQVAYYLKEGALLDSMARLLGHLSIDMDKLNSVARAQQAHRIAAKRPQSV